jgi:ankyrin repeat protein
LAIKNAKKDTAIAVNRIKERTEFFEMVARGKESDMNCIINYLESDPNKFLISCHDDTSFVNTPNSKGLTAIYVACMNGNEAMVHLLLERGANPQKIVYIKT